MWIAAIITANQNRRCHLPANWKNKTVFLIIDLSFSSTVNGQGNLLGPVCISACVAVKMLSPNHARPSHLLHPLRLLTTVYRKCLYFDFDNVVAIELTISFVDALKFRHRNGLQIWFLRIKRVQRMLWYSNEEFLNSNFTTFWRVTYSSCSGTFVNQSTRWSVVFLFVETLLLASSPFAFGTVVKLSCTTVADTSKPADTRAPTILHCSITLTIFFQSHNHIFTQYSNRISYLCHPNDMDSDGPNCRRSHDFCCCAHSSSFWQNSRIK